MGRRIGRLWGGGSAGCGEEDLQSGLFYENKDRFSRSKIFVKLNSAGDRLKPILLVIILKMKV